MTKFKVGDKVRVLPGEGYDPSHVRVRHPLVEGAEYNVIGNCANSDNVKIDLDFFNVGDNHSIWEADRFELVIDPIIAAVRHLTSLGYTISEPTPKLTGKVHIIQKNDGHIFASFDPPIFGHQKTIAIVDWTEGDGLD